MKTLFLIQSLKGTIEAAELCSIVRKVFGGSVSDILPVTDGGDGFLNTVHFYNKHLNKVPVSTVNAEGETIEVSVLQDHSSVFIESADIIGLKQLHGDSDPLMRSTEGLGCIIKEFYDERKTVYIGLGGSATVDIGCGMLTSLGFKTVHYPGTNVLRNTISREQYPLLTGVCDVYNTLEGEKGAIVYAGQKGVRSETMAGLAAMFQETSRNLGIEGMEYSG
ncbi:MAG: glycerate kinase, partial [candidate division WOR-3 bacterium]|nr:glycerate kinase [candidate division WOR-3 bacterium]